MRLLVVNPNTTQTVTDRIARAAAAAVAGRAEIDAVTAPFGVPYIVEEHQLPTGAAAVLSVLTDPARRYDGAVVAAFGDPGLDEARRRLPVPVVGIAEAAMLTACMLGRRFGVVTTVPTLIPAFRALAAAYGLDRRLAGVRGEATDLNRIATDADSVAAMLTLLARTVIEKDGADVVILGGGPLAGMDRRIADAVGVPVLDGVSCAVRQAMLLVELRARAAGTAS